MSKTVNEEHLARLFEQVSAPRVPIPKVAKHAEHDQSTHGNWAQQRADLLAEHASQFPPPQWSQGSTPKGAFLFTDGGGQRPGKRLYKMDGVWHEAKVHIDLLGTLDDELMDLYYNPDGGVDDESELFDDYAKARKVIVDALNDVSPEFRPKEVIVAGGVGWDSSGTAGNPPVGGAHYVPATDTIEIHPAALGLSEDTLDYLPSNWWDVVDAGLRPAFLRKLMIHELGHVIDERLARGDVRVGQSIGVRTQWRTARNTLAKDWFKASEDLLDPEGPTTWYLYQNFVEGTDAHGRYNAPSELFAEHFANAFVGTPIPNSEMVDEVLDSLYLTDVLVPRDGDGDGLIFDGTGRERSA